MIEETKQGSRGQLSRRSNHQTSWSRSEHLLNESAGKRKPLSRQAVAATANQVSEIFQVQSQQSTHFQKRSTHNSSMSPNRLRPSARFMQRSAGASSYSKSSFSSRKRVVPSNLTKDFKETFARRELT